MGKRCGVSQDLRRLSLAVFSAFLKGDDAQRASTVVERLLADGFHGALTGSLATEAQLRAHGRPIEWHSLNDLDLVVDNFSAIPESLADRFLLHHVHPHAPEGKTLLQLVDEENVLRVDLFRAFGATLTRVHLLDEQTGFAAGARRRGPCCETHGVRLRSVAPGARNRREARARLHAPDAVWANRRDSLKRGKTTAEKCPEALEEAAQQANQLLGQRPDLLICDTYSSVVTACEQCRDSGAFAGRHRTFDRQRSFTATGASASIRVASG